MFKLMGKKIITIFRERRGSVVECLTRDRRATGSSLTGVTLLLSLSKTHYPSLVLVQPRKTRPYITERLLMAGMRKFRIDQDFLFEHWHMIYIMQAVFAEIYF